MASANEPLRASANVLEVNMELVRQYPEEYAEFADNNNSMKVRSGEVGTNNIIICIILGCEYWSFGIFSVES
jgi:hypothetical protein